jgi:4-aminobutyrate aminotransferase/(S)-3-amino-2-methylpropionate transaminase
MVAMEFVQPGTKDAERRGREVDCQLLQPARRHRDSCGTYGNVVRLLPPLVITDAQLADGLDVLGAAVH